MLTVSIGIPAYNEEANIGKTLECLSKQRLEKVKIAEIIVIASGCTDSTARIVTDYKTKDKRVKLLEQVKREGKTSADNLFFANAKANILVLIGADTLPETDCLEELVKPFADPKVGVTGAKIIPLNKKNSFSGFFSHLWWNLFHKVSLNYFRAGEIMAFRKVIKKIPPIIGNDEVFLTDAIMAKNFLTTYVPSAVAYNRGPETIREIVGMRRRNACLHFQFRRWGPRIYFPKTMDNLYVLKLFVGEINWFSAREVYYGLLSVLTEGFCRLLAYFDFYLLNQKYIIWPRNHSTKRLAGFRTGRGVSPKKNFAFHRG